MYNAKSREAHRLRHSARVSGNAASVQNDQNTQSPSHVIQVQTERDAGAPIFAPNGYPNKERMTEHTPTDHATQWRFDPALKPKIIYFVISRVVINRVPLLHRRYWRDGSLSGKSIAMIFNDVEASMGRRDINSIVFKLTTSQRTTEIPIARYDTELYEIMKSDFVEDINVDLAGWERTFYKIELEPDAVPIAYSAPGEASSS